MMNTAHRLKRRAADDRGMVGIAACLMIVVVLAGATLIFDGGRALNERRQIINTAEAASRAGVATADETGLDASTAESAARRYVSNAGVAGGDIISIDVTRTTVTVRLRAQTDGVFTSLLGNDTITVTGTGSAAWNYGD